MTRAKAAGEHPGEKMVDRRREPRPRTKEERFKRALALADEITQRMALEPDMRVVSIAIDLLASRQRVQLLEVAKQSGQEPASWEVEEHPSPAL